MTRHGVQPTLCSPILADFPNKSKKSIYIIPVARLNSKAVVNCSQHFGWLDVLTRTCPMTMSLAVTFGSKSTRAETKMLRLFAVKGKMLAPSMRSTACTVTQMQTSHQFMASCHQHKHLEHGGHKKSQQNEELPSGAKQGHLR